MDWVLGKTHVAAISGLAGLMALVAALVLSASATAHIERSSYWPLPAADCSIHPCAGGAVPTPRSLASAIRPAHGSTTRVVCQPGSMRRLRTSIVNARRNGYFIRPTDHRSFSAGEAKRLLATNKRLFAMCRYHEIQPAVTASHNNGRVVIMPGVYIESTSRKAPTNDPSCAKYKTVNDTGTGALSYTYQVHCPNDQNLIAVMGRAVGSGADPAPPLIDRHGIPNLGPCVRCNLQVEGSGVSADDVVIDAGNVAAGNGPPRGSVKDVGIRADRADGFVLRNITVRHAKEHDIYVVESNGYLLDDFKVYWAGEYGVLTFVEDHGLMQNCDAAGSGDSGLYPGAGAKTGVGRDTKVYPEFRYSQEIRDCDSHHNLGGYSGTDGNSTHVDHDNFYDNTLGFTTDVFTASGHPGFPQSSDLVEYNNFYSNNFNPYVANSPIAASEPEPVGVGLWIAGGNDDVIRFNHFYDNWRRGVMLFAVPDATVCGPPPLGTKVTGCDPTKTSTSYNDRFYGNVMGVAPDGTSEPNGVDFWWDNFAGNTGNCWYQNTTSAGHSITSQPANLPACANGANPGASVGLGDVGNEAELLGCFASFTGGVGSCPWFTTPPKPTTAAADVWRRSQDARMARLAAEPAVRSQICALTGLPKIAPCSA